MKEVCSFSPPPPSAHYGTSNGRKRNEKERKRCNNACPNGRNEKAPKHEGEGERASFFFPSVNVSIMAQVNKATKATDRQPARQPSLIITHLHSWKLALTSWRDGEK